MTKRFLVIAALLFVVTTTTASAQRHQNPYLDGERTFAEQITLVEADERFSETVVTVIEKNGAWSQTRSVNGQIKNAPSGTVLKQNILIVALAFDSQNFLELPETLGSNDIMMNAHHLTIEWGEKHSVTFTMSPIETYEEIVQRSWDNTRITQEIRQFMTIVKIIKKNLSPVQ